MPPPGANTLYALVVVAIVLVPLLAGLFLLYRCKEQRKAEAQKVLVGWWRRELHVRRIQQRLKVIIEDRIEEKRIREEEKKEEIRRIEEVKMEEDEEKRQFTAEDDKVIWNEIKRYRRKRISPGIEEAFGLIDENRRGVLSRAEVIKACEANEMVRTLLRLPKKQEDLSRGTPT